MQSSVVDPACRAGFRGDSRDGLSSNPSNFNPQSHQHVHRVRLAAKVLSGRKDLHKTAQVTDVKRSFFLFATPGDDMSRFQPTDEGVIL
ncbi:MAG: hypothetical protein FJ267_00895 [Planctomycetes bacterium]|nr:hypothetical protein [Planctomycetota bacterium]